MGRHDTEVNKPERFVGSKTLAKVEYLTLHLEHMESRQLNTANMLVIKVYMQIALSKEKGQKLCVR